MFGRGSTRVGGGTTHGSCGDNVRWSRDRLVEASIVDAFGSVPARAHPGGRTSVAATGRRRPARQPVPTAHARQRPASDLRVRSGTAGHEKRRNSMRLGPAGPSTCQVETLVVGRCVAHEAPVWRRRRAADRPSMSGAALHEARLASAPSSARPLITLDKFDQGEQSQFSVGVADIGIKNLFRADHLR